MRFFFVIFLHFAQLSNFCGFEHTGQDPFLLLFLRSYLFSLVFPVSMTNTTSGIVTPVSAMLVDNTI